MFHGVDIAVLVAVLLATALDEADGLDVVGDLLEVQADAHTPRARTTPVRVQYRLQITTIIINVTQYKVK